MSDEPSPSRSTRGMVQERLSPYAELESYPLPDEDKAVHVQRYLVKPDDATPAESAHAADTQPSASAFSVTSSRISMNEDEYQAPHHMPGGAITEDLYRRAHKNMTLIHITEHTPTRLLAYSG